MCNWQKVQNHDVCKQSLYGCTRLSVFTTYVRLCGESWTGRQVHGPSEGGSKLLHSLMVLWDSVMGRHYNEAIYRSRTMCNPLHGPGSLSGCCRVLQTGGVQILPLWAVMVSERSRSRRSTLQDFRRFNFRLCSEVRPTWRQLVP